MDKEKIYLNALISSKILTRKRLLVLKKMFSSWEGVYHNLDRYLLSDLGIDFSKIEDRYHKFMSESPEEAFLKLERNKIKVAEIEELKFPYLLKQIKDPPILLYFKGDLFDPRRSLAIVGSRNPSFYGEKITQEFSSELSDLGITIVSGLALGVDKIAHENSYLKKGKTMAVLGSSLDLVYPRENLYLSEKIIDSGGILISEYPLGSKPEIFQFPERNRLISGLSLGVLITEASKKSGTRITAEFALEQGREVLAVPGAITNKLSGGTNQLLQEGARVITSVQDVLDIFGWKSEVSKSIELQNLQELTHEEKLIYSILSLEPKDLSIIINDITLDFITISQTLSCLELKGLVKNIGNNQYIRN